MRYDKLLFDDVLESGNLLISKSSGSFKLVGIILNSGYLYIQESRKIRIVTERRFTKVISLGNCDVYSKFKKEVK